MMMKENPCKNYDEIDLFSVYKKFISYFRITSKTTFKEIKTLKKGREKYKENEKIYEK